MITASVRPLTVVSAARTVLLWVTSLIAGLTTGLAIAQSAPLGVINPAEKPYPNKVIRVLTTEAGGGSDFNARLICQALSAVLGQQIVVDNRSGSISTETAARATSDGYTLLFNGSAVWLLPFLRDNVPYDPLRDLAPVSLATSAPGVLVTHPAVPAKTVAELIALAKARPGELNYAAGAMGAPPHLAAELFNAMAGVKIVRVNYKGAGSAINDLMGGQIQLMFPTAGSVIQHVRSGRLKALAVTSAEPSRLLPELPTVAAALPGFEATAPLGIFVPARTPQTVIARLHKEITHLLEGGEVKERFLRAGVETVGGTPAQLAARMKSDQGTLGKLIRDVGIRAN